MKKEPRKTIVFVPSTLELERQQVEYFRRKLEEGAEYLRKNPPKPEDEIPFPITYEVVKLDDDLGLVRRITDGKIVLHKPAKLQLCEVFARALSRNAATRKSTQ